MHKVLIRNKKYLLFVFILIVLGFALGTIYYWNLDSSIKSNIVETISSHNNFQYNFILKDLIIMSFLLISSFFIIGGLLSIIYILYSSFTLGFLIPIFFYVYHLNGLIYVLLFIIINKAFCLIFKLSFIKKTINISRGIIGLLLNKKDEYLKKRVVNNFKYALYIILIVFVINILLSVISPKIFANLAFLLYNIAH